MSESGQRRDYVSGQRPVLGNDMLKSWLITLIVLFLLAAAYYFRLFDWLAGAQAKWLGFILVIIMLALAFIILGNPLKKK